MQILPASIIAICHSLHGRSFCFRLKEMAAWEIPKIQEELSSRVSVLNAELPSIGDIVFFLEI